jgi:uncharacterized protein Veg
MFGLNAEEVIQACEVWYKKKGLDIANKLKNEIQTDGLMVFSEYKNKLESLVKRAENLSAAIEHTVEMCRNEIALAVKKTEVDQKEVMRSAKESLEMGKSASTNAELNSTRIKTIMGMCERIVSVVEHGEKSRAAAMSHTAEIVGQNSEALMATMSRLESHLGKIINLQSESNDANMQKIAAIKELTKVFASTVIVEEAPAPKPKKRK